VLYFCVVIYSVSRKKGDQKYFLHNFYKFTRIAIIFGKQHRECIEKLLVERMSTSPTLCCYFALQSHSKSSMHLR